MAALFAREIGSLVAAAEDAVAVVAVDMPVGVPERGRRQADVAARAVLGRRWSSVFMTPVRAALDADSYEEAVRANRVVTGEGLSRQAWALRAKLLEVEAWSQRANRPVIEVHPEVSFAACQWPSPVDRCPTRSPPGPESIPARRCWPASPIVLPADLGAAGRAAGVDDVLDAAVVAWSARRYLAGVARPLPDPPQRLVDGRPCAIWS